MNVSVDLHQLILFPHPIDYLPVQSIELPSSLNHILIKLPLKYLSISQLNSPETLLSIHRKFSIIELPEVIQTCEISKIKLLI